MSPATCPPLIRGESDCSCEVCTLGTTLLEAVRASLAAAAKHNPGGAARPRSALSSTQMPSMH